MRETGRLATSPPGTGACRLHAGSTPNAVAKAERGLARRRATELLATLSAPQPLGDPIEALVELGSEVLRLQTVCRTLLGEASSLESVDAMGVERSKPIV